jgi:hypothetical protein
MIPILGEVDSIRVFKRAKSFWGQVELGTSKNNSNEEVENDV